MPWVGPAGSFLAMVLLLVLVWGGQVRGWPRPFRPAQTWKTGLSMVCSMVSRPPSSGLLPQLEGVVEVGREEWEE